MSYYRLLGFEQEPFSTSPDPDFFYSSRAHERALTNVLIELRLKRGLSVVLGDVGTGKTTLSRKLVQDLKSRPDCAFHIVLDPDFESPKEFMRSLVRNFAALSEAEASAASITELREALERFLFQKGVVERKSVILLVDEAQKLSEASIETLRVLLNYETNDFKLLQLVLLGQNELLTTLRSLPNFLDRVSFKTVLPPLDYGEMCELIRFRLQQAGFRSRQDLFLEEGLREIHQFTNGYPRKVTMICHRALKEMILKNRYAVDRELIEGIVADEVSAGWQTTDPLVRKNSFSA